MCNKVRFILLVSVVLCSAVSRTQAQLRWDQREVTLHPAAGDKSIIADFGFSNVGTTAVSITKVDTSCGCTTAKMDRDTYQTQESGTLKATFTFAGRVGWQHKEIAVRTTDQATPVTLLKLHVFVPDPVQISSTGVEWKLGEERTPKTIRIEVLNHALEVTAAACADERFRCELKTLEAGKSYQVTITPLSTSQANSAFVQLKTDDSNRPTIHLQASVSDS